MEKFDTVKGKWEKVADVQGTKCPVSKLTEGHDYKFRVIALNRNGESEPLETERAVTAKKPYGKLFAFNCVVLPEILSKFLCSFTFCHT